MGKKVNPTIIGAFVAGAVVLAVAGVMIFASGKFLTETQKWVMYFDGSIKGLNVGAPVTFRGVKVGSVTEIRVTVDPRDMSIRTPVIIELAADRFTLVGGGTAQFSEERRGAEQLIKRGLRAQLALQSLVTGQLGVELDFHPDEPVRLAGIESAYPEFPTIPSSMEELTKTIENIPLEDLTKATLHAIQGIDRLVHAPEVKQLLRSLRDAVADVRTLVRNVDDNVVAPLGPGIASTADAAHGTLEEARETLSAVRSSLEETLVEFRRLVRNVDSRVAPLASTIEDTSEAARAALVQGKKALSTIDDVAGERSPLRYDLRNTLQELSAAARSLRVLADYLERHPEALLAGKGGS